MEYKVISRDNFQLFSSAVTDAINTGWELQGGICVVEQALFKETRLLYYQAVTKGNYV